MLSYFRELPDYAGRLLWRMDTATGIIIGLAFFLIAYLTGLSQNLVVVITVAIIMLSAMEAGYQIYREERTMRSEVEKDVIVKANLSSLAANMPDPGPDKSSLTVEVILEIWVKEDVSTDMLALNLIYVYDRSWWQFWKRTRFPQTGIPAKENKDSTLYRKRIYAQQFQPHRESFTFEYVGDRHIEGDPHWVLELVLTTGVPVGEHRIPIFIDHDLEERRANPPL